MLLVGNTRLPKSRILTRILGVAIWSMFTQHACTIANGRGCHHAAAPCEARRTFFRWQFASSTFSRHVFALERQEISLRSCGMSREIRKGNKGGLKSLMQQFPFWTARRNNCIMTTAHCKHAIYLGRSRQIVTRLGLRIKLKLKFRIQRSPCHLGALIWTTKLEFETNIREKPLVTDHQASLSSWP